MTAERDQRSGREPHTSRPTNLVSRPCFDGEDATTADIDVQRNGANRAEKRISLLVEVDSLDREISVDLSTEAAGDLAAQLVAEV